MIWPSLLFVAVSSRWKALPFVVVLIVGLISFAACICALNHDASVAFFLTPFRIYEFAGGATVVWLERVKIRQPIVSEGAYLLGLGLITYSIFAFNELTVFPGVTALVPSIGTALAIYAGSSARSAIVLSNRAVVFIGRISYSLYLIHWPITVFVNYVVAEIRIQNMIFIIAASFALAVPMYYFIEMRFRGDTGEQKMSAPAFGLAACLLSLPLILLSATSWAQSGWVWRLPKEIQAINDISISGMNKFLWQEFPNFRNAEFTGTKKKLLIIGDSQAADFLNMMLSMGMDRKLNIVVQGSEYKCGVVYLPDDEAKKAFWTKENIRTIKEPNLIPACQTTMSHVE